MAQLPQKGDLKWDVTLNTWLLVEHKEDGTHDNTGGSSSTVGVIIMFPGSTAPTGWLICDGAEVSRTEYANLYTAIADLYGAGDGSTTFNVPDLRGEFVRGVDAGRGVDGGRTLGSAQGDGFKSHTHTGSTSTDGNHSHVHIPTWGGGAVGYHVQRGPGISGLWRAEGNVTSVAGNHTHSLSINATGGGETRPRNVAMNYIIKF